MLKTRTLQLIITEQCNLNCVYCYETEKRDRRMPLSIACEKVEKYLTADDGMETVVVDFFGGEPLLAFDTIREVVRFVHSRTWPKKHKFCLSTNGTLLNEEMKEWFRRHRCVMAALSMDGTKAAHDRNRCGSYDRVMANVGFFREMWPKQAVKMTVSQHTVGDLAAGIKNIASLGLKVEANVVFENVWGAAEAELLKIYETQLEELVDFYADRPAEETPRIINLPLHGLLAKSESDKWCGCGVEMTAVDPDGTEHPCQRFARFCGPPAKTLKKSGCAACDIKRICPTCKGHNYMESGDPEARTDYHCGFILLQILATARLRYRRMLKSGTAPAREAAVVKRAVEAVTPLYEAKLGYAQIH